MMVYCTLFDSFYLSRGLVMYESLKAEARDFHLYIFAFDDLSYRMLSNLNLQYATVISLDEFETPELKEVKKSRTKAEYCWTCTPSVISYVLKKYDEPLCTYVDADLFFYSDPSVLVAEMYESGNNVLITEHRYSFLPKLHGQEKAGRFCVQFITFTRNGKSRDILETWRKQCLEWCFARYENGLFGDQKYLDPWPQKYNGVHILQHPGGGIAPWNLTQYSFSREGDNIIGREKRTNSVFPVVFYHFQYVKTMDNNCYDTGWYIISASATRIFYFPYLEKIHAKDLELEKADPEYKIGLSTFKTDSLKNIVKKGFKKILGYNLIKLKV